MTLQKAILKLSADVDGDGTAENGEFHMVGNLEVTPKIIPNFVVGGRGSTVNSIISSLVGDGTNKRQNFFIDLGGGIHAVEISFRGWEGAQDDSGNNVQWGNDSAQTKTQASATGQDPITQIDVLMRYLTVGEYDSRNTGTLEYGEYSSGGLYSPLNVVVEGPTMTRAASDGQWYDGNMQCIVAADLTTAWDAQQRNSY